jgi:hypothetical protein
MELIGNLALSFQAARARYDFLLPNKKRRHERSSCSCREASDANYFREEEKVSTTSTTGINTA